MYVCRACRWVNPDGVRFCQKCGCPREYGYVVSGYDGSGALESCQEYIRWNWFAFLLGGIWAVRYKLYWPLVMELVYVLFFIVAVPIPSPSPDYDEYIEGRFILNDWQCALLAFKFVLFWICVAIHIILGRRGNALKRGIPLFKQFTRKALVMKRFNWWAMFGGGAHGFILHKYWMSVPLMSLGLCMMIWVFSPLMNTGNEFYRLYLNVLIYILIVLVVLSIPLAIVSGIKTNAFILAASRTDAECIAIYNKCRLLSLSTCIVQLWVVSFVWCIFIYGS